MSHLIIENSILQEPIIKKIDYKKAIFRMVMQTVDEVNKNRRLYPRSVLQNSMKDIDGRIKSRSFTGEMDHPFPTGHTEVDAIRQSTVAFKDVSHLVRDYEFQNNKLMGELETLDTIYGRQLLGLLKDKVGVGLSMRGMAELEKKENMNVVTDPLLIISFDSVSTPSHTSAIVNFSEMRFESISILNESSCGTTICTSDGKCYLSNYFDKLIESHIIKFEKKWF